MMSHCSTHQPCEGIAVADSVSQVITEILAGDSLTLSAAAKLLPAHRGEGAATPSRLSRWAKDGAKTAGGRVIKLETAKFGIQVLTSRAALERFLTALNCTVAADAAPPIRPPAVRRKDAEAA